MALVRVIGYAWDHSHRVIPAVLQPRLFASPLGSQIAGALLADVESQASLSLVTGSFGVDLESDTDYVMWMDWLIPGQENEPPEKRARGRAEWLKFNSGGGGNIATLSPPRATGTIVAALGPPPPSTEDVVWIDLTDVTSGGALVYSPGRG